MLRVSDRFVVFIRLFFKIVLVIFSLFFKYNVGINISEVNVKDTLIKPV